MQIIKITPHSFKIILTKDDLRQVGAENIIQDAADRDFLREIIDKTNEMYDHPFDAGTINAEFFESKDGGAELFLFTSGYRTSDETYILTTDTVESILPLCNVLANDKKLNESSLYCSNNIYYLFLVYAYADRFTSARLMEYGSFSKASKLLMWHITEHAKVIFENNALERLAEIFGTAK